MPWEDDLAEDIESRRACMRAAAAGAYAAAAALCREAGCICRRLRNAQYKHDTVSITEHDPACPYYLAARIGALGGRP